MDEEVQIMINEANNTDDLGYTRDGGAGYSVFFQEDKLLSYSEVYNWWKMKRIMTKMIKEEKFGKNRAYKVLDIGCSRGYDIFRINREFSYYDIKYVGLDIISSDIEFANNIARNRGLRNVKFVVGNAEKMEFDDNTFDIITCSEVMEHQEKPLEVFTECYRILKDEGIIIITTPNLNYENILPKGMRNKIKKRVHNGAFSSSNGSSAPKKELPYEKHVCVKNIDEWIDLLKRVDFTIEKLERGSIVYGGPFFDKHAKLMGLLLIFDSILDHITYEYSWNIVIKARKM